MGRSTGWYIGKRLLQLLPLLLGVTLLTFAMLRFAAGDAVELLYENLGTGVSQAVIDARRAELGLDQPFFVQYGRWLWDLLHGDLGDSYISGAPVLPTLLSKVPATLLLTGASLGLTVLLSVPLGILSAVFHGRWIDYLIRAVSFVGNSLPNFFAALLLLLIFAVKLRWLPVIDLGGGGSLVLPSVTLALAMSSRYTRQIRAAVLEELEQDYVTGALARGVGRKTVLFSNVLRAAMGTIITLLAMSAGSLLGGTAIVESIFLWDGVGKLAVDSIALRDAPVVLAYVLWTAILYVLLNLAADLLCRRVDPRIRLGEEGRS